MRKTAILLFIVLLGAPLLASCGFRNPCDTRPTYEARQACSNQLIDFDRQIRGNRAYRTL